MGNEIGAVTNREVLHAHISSGSTSKRCEMSNPWLTKNPFMSMWLSAANSVAGSMRGHAIAQANRQVKAAVVEATSLPFHTPKALTKLSDCGTRNSVLLYYFVE